MQAEKKLMTWRAQCQVAREAQECGILERLAQASNGPRQVAAAPHLKGLHRSA